MYERILQLIKEQGPSLPAEISGKLNTNSFLAKAYMEELVSQGKLKMGERVGDVHIFLLTGQEEIANKRVEEIKNPTRTVGGYVGKDLDMSQEAVAKREHFKKHFEKDIIRLQEEEKKKRETPLEKHVNKIIANVWETEKSPNRSTKSIKVEPVQENLPSGFAPLEKIEQRMKEFTFEAPKAEPPKPIEVHKAELPRSVARETPKIERTRPVEIPRKVEPIKPVEFPKVAQKEGYVDKVVKLFNTDKARVVEEINSAKKAAELVIDFPSSIGAMRFYVEIKDKKSINKADISLAYTEGLARKLPSMIIANGKLAKAAEAYAESLGSLFKFKNIQ